MDDFIRLRRPDEVWRFPRDIGLPTETLKAILDEAPIDQHGHKADADYVCRRILEENGPRCHALEATHDNSGCTIPIVMNASQVRGWGPGPKTR